MYIYNFEKSEEIIRDSKDIPKNYQVKDKDDRILEPSEIVIKLKRLEYLESQISEINEDIFRKELNIPLQCLSCGNTFYGNSIAPHFCDPCKDIGEDLNFKNWIEQFKDNKEIKIMRIISYLYKQFKGVTYD